MRKELDPNESNSTVLWAEIHRLNSLLKGPTGFDTWMDAAVHERLRANAAEEKAAAMEQTAPRYAGWVRDQFDAIAKGATPVLLSPGHTIVNSGALQAAINMLRRDAEEGFTVRGELAEELAAAAFRVE